LKKISFNKQKLELTVGAGSTYTEIYKIINPQGYTIVGGENDVGIGGWMTGGGYSRITSQYGLGIDNLVQAEVVLPHGGVKTASETENPDLFWAIKVCFPGFELFSD
jgi:FAD/FMN-containing dehydrogenase